jgi:hypothetical protein
LLAVVHVYGDVIPDLSTATIRPPCPHQSPTPSPGQCGVRVPSIHQPHTAPEARHSISIHPKHIGPPCPIKHSGAGRLRGPCHPLFRVLGFMVWLNPKWRGGRVAHATHSASLVVLRRAPACLSFCRPPHYSLPTTGMRLHAAFKPADSAGSSALYLSILLGDAWHHR